MSSERYGGEDPRALADDEPEELLLNDAMMGVYNAVQAGWSETDEFTIEQMPGTTNAYEIDLPATRQTVHLTVDITLPRRQ